MTRPKISKTIKQVYNHTNAITNLWEDQTKLEIANVAFQQMVAKLDLIVNFETSANYQNLLEELKHKFNTDNVPHFIFDKICFYNIEVKKSFLQDKKSDNEIQNRRIENNILIVKLSYFLYLVSRQNASLTENSEEFFCYFIKKLLVGTIELFSALENSDNPVFARYIRQYMDLFNQYSSYYEFILNSLLIKNPNEKSYLKKMRTKLCQLHVDFVALHIDYMCYLEARQNNSRALQFLFKSSFLLPLLHLNFNEIFIASADSTDNNINETNKAESLIILTNLSTEYVSRRQVIFGALVKQIPLTTALDNSISKILDIYFLIQEFQDLVNKNGPISQKTPPQNSAQEFQTKEDQLCAILSTTLASKTSFEDRLDPSFLISAFKETKILFSDLKNYRHDPLLPALIHDSIWIVEIWKEFFKSEDTNTQLFCDPILALWDKSTELLKKTRYQIENQPIAVNDFLSKTKEMLFHEPQPALDLIKQYHHNLKDPAFFKIILTNLIKFYSDDFENPKPIRGGKILIEFLNHRANIIGFVCQHLLNKEYSLPPLEENDYLLKFIPGYTVQPNELLRILLTKFLPSFESLFRYHHKLYQGSKDAYAINSSGYLTKLTSYKTLYDAFSDLYFKVAQATLDGNLHNYSADFIKMHRKNIWYTFYYLTHIKISHCVFLAKHKLSTISMEEFAYCTKIFNSFKENHNDLLQLSELTDLEVKEDLKLLIASQKQIKHFAEQQQRQAEAALARLEKPSNIPVVTKRAPKKNKKKTTPYQTKAEKEAAKKLEEAKKKLEAARLRPLAAQQTPACNTKKPKATTPKVKKKAVTKPLTVPKTVSQTAPETIQQVVPETATTPEPFTLPIITEGLIELEHNFTLPKTIQAVLDDFEAAGYFAFVTGGYPRDLFLGIKPNDYDIITNCPADEIMKVLIRQGAYESKNQTGLFHIGAEKSDISSTDCTTLAEHIDQKGFLYINSLFWNKKTIYGHPQVLDDLTSEYFNLIHPADNRFKNEPSLILRLLYYKQKIHKKIKPEDEKALIRYCSLILPTLEFGVYSAGLRRFFSNEKYLESFEFLANYQLVAPLVISQSLPLQTFNHSFLYPFWQIKLKQIYETLCFKSHYEVIALLLMQVASIDKHCDSTNRLLVFKKTIQSFCDHFKDPTDADILPIASKKILKRLVSFFEEYDQYRLHMQQASASFVPIVKQNGFVPEPQPHFMPLYQHYVAPSSPVLLNSPSGSRLLRPQAEHTKFHF